MIALLSVLACSPSAEDIATTIASTNPVAREDGAKIAQNYPDEAVEKALISVLGDPSRTIRLNAIESLVQIEATTAGAPLIDRLANDDDPLVRRAAADALGRLKEKGAAAALIAYVQGFGAEDREQLAGIWALGNIGAEGLDPEPRQAVLTALAGRRGSTADRFVRYQTTAALRVLK
ncbi:MAG: HEAT repeat domain-containing protein [Myxococcales bacterium]|nr:HEAT repeat domain-containing protein [Myxococcales bacterium]